MIILLPLLSALSLWAASPGEIGLWWLTPFSLLPLLSFLLRAEKEKKRKRAFFAAGLFFGILLYILLMYWIVNVLAHFGGLPFPLACAALFLLALYMGLYPAFFCLLCRPVLRMPPLYALFLLPAFWVALDWIRSFLFTGIPWLDIGYFYAFEPRLIQCADIFGHYGLTWLTVFINTFIALLLFKQTITKKERLTLSLAGGVIIIAALLYNIVGYSFWEKNNQREKEVVIAVIQGNIAQDEKWSKEIQERTLRHYLQQTGSLLDKEERPLFAVWPETAIPFFVGDNPLTEDIINFTRENTTAILSGAPHYQYNADSNEQRQGDTSQYLFYNAALLFSAERGMSERYYKSHLVPFGEYVPLQKYLFFLAPLVESAGNFSAGSIEKPLQLSFSGREDSAQVKMGILICYEAIFPAISRKWSKLDTNILINLTNDAWYGRTSAPYHSLAMTVLRAVENRRSVVRSANTGFSGLITPSGKIEQCSELFTEAAFTVRAELVGNRSFYTTIGWLFAPFCGLLLFCGIVFFLSRHLLARNTSIKRQAVPQNHQQ